MTKAATIENHRFLVLLLIIAMLAAMIPVAVAVFPGPATAANSDNMSASFTLGNSVPTIDQVLITTHDNITAAGPLSPQVEYIIKVQITDANTLADLTTCNVTLFYDQDSDNDPGDIPSENTTHAAKMVCNVNAGTFDLTPAGTSWAKGADSECPATSVEQGWFCFHITIGKIATQATNGWDIYVSVQDDEPGTPGSATLYSIKNLTMSFYGEVETSGASVDFGSVTAGTTYAAHEVTGKSVTYIANGAYDEQVAASAAWGAATLNTGDNPGANQFCLKANDTADFGGAVQVNDTGTYTTIDDTGLQTQLEIGDTPDTNTLWLRLGSPFTNATYQGYIYFKVINGT